MKTRSKIFRMAFAFLILVALAAWGSKVVLASSSSTTLSTSVPSHFEIDVTIIGDGCIVINGAELIQSAEISLERHQAVQICLLPKENSRVDSVIYNGTSVINKLNNGVILLPALEKNAELKVTFAGNLTTPDTWDTSFDRAICHGVIAMFSLAAIILFAVRRVRYEK